MLCLLLLCAALAPAAETGEEKVVHRLPAAASVFPQGAQPGAKLEAEILGEYLDRAEAIVPFDKDLTAEILDSSPTRLRIQISVSDRAAFGPHYFRVVTPRGASGPLLFRVGDRKRALDTEPNTTLGQAQRVELPVTIDGRLNVDGDFDFYRFEAKAGQTWTFDLRAARNGNGLDAALVLLTAAGVKLAHNEDHFVWDPFFTHTFSETGEYIAVVQPTHRSNDPNFAYELDVRQVPQLQTIAPLSFRPGATAEATIHGAGFGGTNPSLVAPHGITGEITALKDAAVSLRLNVPATAPGGMHELTLISAGGRSNPVRFFVDSTPVWSGTGALHPPVAVTGIIRYRAPERFAFHAAKDQTLVFEVRSNRFGAPTDPLIRILDAKGKAIASNDDFTFAVADFYNKDPRLMHTFQQEGEYTLELRNLVNTAGENFPYQLRVTPPVPHFELAMTTERPYVYPGKDSKWKVTAARRDGHKDAIPVTVAGLPEGITAEPVTIEPGRNEVDVILKADAAAKPGAASAVTISSGAVQAWRPVRISSGGGEGATFARTDTALVTVAEKPSFSLEASVSSVNLPRGGMATIPVVIRREPGFTAAIRFRLENLPPGITMEPATAPPGAAQIELRVRAAAEMTEGRVPRVAILGIAGREHQEAPKIGIQVD